MYKMFDIKQKVRDSYDKMDVSQLQKIIDALHTEKVFVTKILEKKNLKDDSSNKTKE